MQKQSSKEQVFVAVTTPLTWARTQLVSESLTPAVQPVQQSATDILPAAEPRQDVLDNSEHTDAAVTAVQSTAEMSQSIKLSNAHANSRRPAACARAVLEAERTILAAANTNLKTYVVCPGILYGEGSLAGRDVVIDRCWRLAARRSPHHCGISLTEHSVAELHGIHDQARADLPPLS